MTAEFAVWAPASERVELFVDGAVRPMRAETSGWWRSDLPWRGGVDYGFVLDGSDPLPDPRSPWQPQGIHGLSRSVDHAAFAWTDGEWQPGRLADAVIYELHVGTFSAEGTFEGVIEHLDSLLELGITHLELMPVAEFSGDRGWGYDGVDLYAPHHAYGGPEGLKRLVDAAHARGLGVLLDVVYNHLGPEGNNLDRFGPYFTDRYRTPWGDAVNFDGPGSDEVRRFVVDNALAWLRDYHIDGLRLDAVHAIYDASAIHICEEIATAVHELEDRVRRGLVVTAESDSNDPRLLRDPSAGGYGLDAVWADDVHHALHVALTGERSGYHRDFPGLAAVAETLVRPFAWPGAYRAFRRRRHGRRPTRLDGTRFVAFLQNHDQVGNRARGERIGQLAGLERQKVGAALLITAPYVPLLFAGEEWGASTPFPYFTGHADRELAQAVREGRRDEFAAFGWDPRQIPDPQAPGTLEAARLAWDEREQGEHGELLRWYRQLLALRRARPELRDGDREAVRTTLDAAAGWLIVARGRLRVVVNLGTEPARLDLPGRLLLASTPEIVANGEGLDLPAVSAAVLEVPA